MTNREIQKKVKQFKRKFGLLDCNYAALEKATTKQGYTIVEFNHVSFHKADGYEILHDVNFTVEPGKTIGIMGATGAGKSSIIYLLQRLYDARDGCVKVDDVDVRDMSLKQLRGSISMVMQDVFLFSDSINENVKLGKRDIIDMETVKQAAQDAGAPLFVLDGAVIVGTAAQAECDRLCVVTAPFETSVARIVARDGISAEMAARRLNAQTPESTLTAQADYVLRNDFSLAHLQAAAEQLCTKLLAEGGAGKEF